MGVSSFGGRPIGGNYEVELDGSTVNMTTLCYPDAGAVRVIDGSGTTLYNMLLRDHLGSASISLNDTGDIVTGSEQQYYPFNRAQRFRSHHPAEERFGKPPLSSWSQLPF